tara:strand:+ start:251 stop:865 length:615 start_codon:yes stop_codon:yes gene_type:complete
MADVFLDPYTYLLGPEYARQEKQRSITREILGGTAQKNSHRRGGVIGEKERSRVIAQLHISLLPDFVDHIQYPVYKEKNWRHPHSIEQKGEFSTMCLTLSRTSSGRRFPFQTKIWVVTLVCKGTTVCQESYGHGPTSVRRFCGYGVRMFSLYGDPSKVVVEEFGQHNDSHQTNGWKFLPPEVERVKLTPSMMVDAYRYVSLLLF